MPLPLCKAVRESDEFASATHDFGYCFCAVPGRRAKACVNNRSHEIDRGLRHPPRYTNAIRIFAELLKEGKQRKLDKGGNDGVDSNDS